MCEEKTLKWIHDLELDEYVEVYVNKVVSVPIEREPRWTILRVPGGWIYSFYDGDNTSNPVFVPYDHEFEENAEEREVHVLNYTHREK